MLASDNRRLVFEANIANLFDAADAAETSGNPARAALMRKRAAALTERLVQEAE